LTFATIPTNFLPRKSTTS